MHTRFEKISFMKMADIFTNMLLLSVLTACTSREIYSSLQDNARDNCNKMSATDRAACLNRVSAGYDSYKVQRDKATGAAQH